MGHYLGLKFTTTLNDTGTVIIKNLYETHSWKQTAELFTEYPFVEYVAENINELIPFGQPWYLKEINSSFDENNKKWSVNVWFKDFGFRWKVPFKNFLSYVSNEPIEIIFDSEFNEDYRTGKKLPPIKKNIKNYGNSKTRLV